MAALSARTLEDNPDLFLSRLQVRSYTPIIKVTKKRYHTLAHRLAMPYSKAKVTKTRYRAMRNR